MAQCSSSRSVCTCRWTKRVLPGTSTRMLPQLRWNLHCHDPCSIVGEMPHRALMEGALLLVWIGRPLRTACSEGEAQSANTARRVKNFNLQVLAHVAPSAVDFATFLVHTDWRLSGRTASKQSSSVWRLNFRMSSIA